MAVEDPSTSGRITWEADMAEFWFNVRTGQVEEGQQSHGGDLMGPYDSAAEAARAYEIARERTEKWDAEDAAEEEEWG